MASRLHRIGTIFSRVDGAFRKGLISENDLPIWFNIYKRFPPKYEPKYTTNYGKARIRSIFYEEDILRAEIHKLCSGKQDPVDLINEATKTKSQNLLKTCQQYMSDGMTKEDALKKIKEFIDSKGNQKSYKHIMQDIKEIIPSSQSPS